MPVGTSPGSREPAITGLAGAGMYMGEEQQERKTSVA